MALRFKAELIPQNDAVFKNCSKTNIQSHVSSAFAQKQHKVPALPQAALQKHSLLEKSGPFSSIIVAICYLLFPIVSAKRFFCWILLERVPDYLIDLRKIRFRDFVCETKHEHHSFQLIIRLSSQVLFFNIGNS